MNASSDVDPAQPGKPTSVGKSDLPSNWREALTSLIASRVDLIQLESKDVVATGARRLAYLIAGVVFAGFAWALILAGAIAVIAQAIHKPWFWVAIVIGLLHLLVGIALMRLAKPSETAAFPITRAEFKKDREWLNHFHENSKSDG